MHLFRVARKAHVLLFALLLCRPVNADLVATSSTDVEWGVELLFGTGAKLTYTLDVLTQPIPILDTIEFDDEVERLFIGTGQIDDVLPKTATVRTTIEDGQAGVNADTLVMRSLPGPTVFPPIGTQEEFNEAFNNGVVEIQDFSIALGTSMGEDIQGGDTTQDAFQALADGDFTQLFSSFLILKLTPGPNPDLSLFAAANPIERRYLLEFGSAAIVPEPSAFLFLGLVGVAFAGWQWKKRRNA